MWSRLGATIALCLGMVAITAAPAHAEAPVDLDGAYVLDTVGAITGREAEVQAALDTLYDRARIQLFVVYVDTFTGAPEGDWATQTAIANGLGTSDILLAVATEDRNFEVSVADDFRLSDAQLANVESNFLIPQLRDDHWAEAAIAAADGYAAEASGVVGPNAPSTDEPTRQDINPAVPIVGGIAVVGVGGLIAYGVRRRRREDAATAPTGMTQKQRDQRASSLLVQLDDSLKTSEQELGFAAAQFGDAATADFETALASARAKVAEAFALRQQLDDSEPETAEAKLSMTTRIIELCEAADAELDAQADAFDALRELEKNAPQELVAVRKGATALSQRLPEVAAVVAALESRYAPTAVASVAGNAEQAGKLRAFVDEAAAKADQAIAAGSSAQAAIAVRTAQASLGQAQQLLDAVDALARDLAETSAKLDAAIADTTQDIAAARALAMTAGEIAPAIDAAEAALASAPHNDPVASLPALQAANEALDTVVGAAQDRARAIARAQSQLDATLAGARSQIASANEFISTRRGGVGDTARTRLSEADRRLTQATMLAASDPVAALAEAQQAARLATGAFNYARDDVAEYDGSSYNDNASSSYSDSADLGGIFTDWLFGGGGGSGGGSSSRSSYRSGSSYRSSRSSRSGSFGGSSRSSSRSSGGRRSRGGRF